MSLGENSLVAAYQGKGQLKSRPSGTRVVTIIIIIIIIIIERQCDDKGMLYRRPGDGRPWLVEENALKYCYSSVENKPFSILNCSCRNE